jgi:hypothetical protein
MVIKINYTSSDVYVSTSVSPVYVVVNYSAVNNGGGGAIWGGITGTLSDQTDLQDALNAKVPYTGATQAVNLGAYDLTVNSLTIGKGNNALVNNTALGHSTLLTATTGNFNTAVGYESLRNTTTGQYNTAVGQSSLFSNTTGGQNTALGLNALLSNTSGSSNVAVGLDSLQHITTGSSNTAIGYNAGSHITGGSTPNTTATNSVFIGRDSKANADGQTNQIVIGQNAVGNGSNTATFGNTATTANYFTGSINGGSFVKSGGTSSQFLKADGSVDSTTYVGGSGTSGQVAYWNGTSSQTGSNNLFWDDANSRLGIGTNTPSSKLQVNNSVVGESLRINGASNTSLIFNTDSNGRAFISVLGNPSATSTAGAYFTADGYQEAWFNVVSRVAGSGNKYWRFGNLGSSSLFAIQKLNDAADTITGSPLTIFSTGNVLLQGNNNSVVDSGQRLQVMGNAYIKGSGTDGSSALSIQNSAGNQLLKLQNDGNFYLNNSASYLYASFGAGQADLSGASLSFSHRGALSEGGDFIILGSNKTLTSSNASLLSLIRWFTPTSGTGIYNYININPTINQTGGANGITRGLYVNPTLTAAADWRSIEWSNNSGWGLYGAGTANNYLGGSLGIAATGLTGVSLFVNKNLTGSTGTYSIIGAGTIQSDSTSQAYYFLSSASTQNATFTVGDVGHFVADQQTFGASSTVTRQYGVRVRANLIGAVNNFAFYGEIPNGTNRWNLYMAGTADNYLEGKLLIGTTTVSTFKLDVNGTARVQTSITSPQFTIQNRLDILSDGANGVIAMQTLTNSLNLRKYVKVLGDDGGYGNNDASAAFQIDGTNRGFLPPRLTTTEKNAISSPAAGLIVYDTTLNKLCVRGASSWETITSV